MGLLLMVPNNNVPRWQLLLSHTRWSFPGRMNSLCPSGLSGMVTVVSPPAQDLQPSEGDLTTSFSLQLSLKQCWMKTSPSNHLLLQCRKLGHYNGG